MSGSPFFQKGGSEIFQQYNVGLEKAISEGKIVPIRRSHRLVNPSLASRHSEQFRHFSVEGYRGHLITIADEKGDKKVLIIE